MLLKAGCVYGQVQNLTRNLGNCVVKVSVGRSQWVLCQTGEFIVSGECEDSALFNAHLMDMGGRGQCAPCLRWSPWLGVIFPARHERPMSVSLGQLQGAPGSNGSPPCNSQLCQSSLICHCLNQHAAGRYAEGERFCVTRFPLQITATRGTIHKMQITHSDI